MYKISSIMKFHFLMLTKKISNFSITEEFYFFQKIDSAPAKFVNFFLYINLIVLS